MALHFAKTEDIHRLYSHAASYKYRNVFTKGYIMSGYRASHHRNAVNRFYNSTDTNANLGTNVMTNTGAYICGAESPNNGYAFGVSNTWGASVATTEHIKFATETWGVDTAHNMTVSRHNSDSMNAEEAAYLTGGGSATTDKLDYTTETMTSSGTMASCPGGNAAGYGAIASDLYGIQNNSTNNRILTFSTDTWSGNVGTQGSGWASPGQNWGLNTKEGFGYFIGGNANTTGRKMQQVYYATANTVTVSTYPTGWFDSTGGWSSGAYYQGETNNVAGHNHGRILGGFDTWDYSGLGGHSQNIFAFKINYSSHTVTRETSLDMIGYDNGPSGQNSTDGTGNGGSSGAPAAAR